MKPALAVYQKDSERKRIVDAVALRPGEMVVEATDSYTADCTTAFAPECPDALAIAKTVPTLRGLPKKGTTEASVKWIYRVKSNRFTKIEVGTDGKSTSQGCQMVVLRRSDGKKNKTD